MVNGIKIIESGEKIVEFKMKRRLSRHKIGIECRDLNGFDILS